MGGVESTRFPRMWPEPSGSAIIARRSAVRSAARRIGEGRAVLSRFVIHGGRPLEGEIVASGSKNAVLPMIAAALKETCEKLSNKDATVFRLHKENF